MVYPCSSGGCPATRAPNPLQAINTVCGGPRIAPTCNRNRIDNSEVLYMGGGKSLLFDPTVLSFDDVLGGLFQVNG